MAAVILLIFLTAVFFLVLSQKNSEKTNINQKSSTGSASSDQNKSDQQTQNDPNTGPIKSIGVNLDYYNSATNRSGDFLFTKEKLQFSRLFMPYGFVIPANMTSGGADKANPQPTFVLPLGTKVLSLVDGEVFDTPKVWSGDYSIQVMPEGQSGGSLIFETEHVLNPLVKKGDRVKAGQVIAEVSNFDKNLPKGYGTVEIGVLQGGNPPKHLCPFLYLDPSVKQQILTKIADLIKNWETYIGDNTLYDETLTNPGCITTDPIEG